MGSFTIEEKFEKLKKVFEKNNFNFVPLRQATAEEFYHAIGQAKKTNPYGPFVEQHTIEEYTDMPFLFLTFDCSAGVAITQDNNIVSIFNGGQQKGLLKTLIPTALEFGGNKLDNYDSDKLSSLYELYGFNPISKVKFNETFASSDWNYERDGKPDIVFWLHKGDDVDTVLYNFGEYDIDWDCVEEFSTYEEAKKYRDAKEHED